VERGARHFQKVVVPMGIEASPQSWSDGRLAPVRRAATAVLLLLAAAGASSIGEGVAGHA
jgi:hypothetical protein